MTIPEIEVITKVLQVPNVMMTEVNSAHSGGNQIFAGIIGLVITISLWLVATWRLLFHMIGRKYHSRRQHQTLLDPPSNGHLNHRHPEEPHRTTNYIPGLTLRQTFHLLLWAATTLEIAAYANLAGLFTNTSTINNEEAHEEAMITKTKIGYILLDLLGRSLFEFLAFMTVAELWFQTVHQMDNHIDHKCVECISRSLRMASGLFAVLMTVLSVTISTILVIQICTPHHNPTLVELETHSLLFQSQIVMEAVGWAVMAAWVAICVYRTAQRLDETLATESSSETFWVRAKVLAPMLICVLCYLTRTFFLASRLEGYHTMHLTQRFHPVWWIGFVWMPSLTVFLVCLYSVRKRDPLPEERLVVLLFDLQDPNDGFMNPYIHHNDEDDILGSSSDRAQAQLLRDDSSPLLYQRRPIPPVETFSKFRQMFTRDVLAPFRSTPGPGSSMADHPFENTDFVPETGSV